MRKTLTLLTALALSVSLLAGCGAKGGAENQAEGTKAPAESAAEQTAETGSSISGEAARKEPSTEDSADMAPAKELLEDSLPESNSYGTQVRVTALKGPTAMGMVPMMESVTGTSNGQNTYTYTITPSVDAVTPALVQGETDIAAVPANLASVLYNNTKGQVQVLAINTLGVLYIAESGESVQSVSDLKGKTIYASGKGASPEYALNYILSANINTLGVLYIAESGESVQSVSDLKGKTIYASGKGASPEYALNYILSANGIDPEKDVTIEWKAEHSECVAALSSQEGGIAMLPQPFVTTAQAKNEKLRIALDLTEEWDKVQEGSEAPSAMLTGVVVVRTQFAQEHPEAVNAFLDSYKASVEYANANVEETAELIEAHDIVPAPVARKALPACNIVFIEGDEMKEKLSGYLNVLYEQNPKAVGGQLPGEDFYYSR